VDEHITFIGLDVHKATIAVAIAEGGRREAARFVGEIDNTPAALAKLAQKYARKGAVLSFCYEAGPCGYGVHRQLVTLRHECVVVAPSLIPRRPGERIKTDRRDALTLAHLHRAGELRPVWVPDTAHEAMRDLVRARLVAISRRSLRRGCARWVSRPKEFHLRPLAEPDVNLSAHPAPTTLRYDRYPSDQ
jgi:transposase